MSNFTLSYIKNDFSYFEEFYNPNEPLFCDTETCFIYKDIRLVQLYQKDWPKVLIFDIVDIPLWHVYDLIKEAYIIFHNFVFDASCFMEDLNLKNNPFPNFEDTLLLARIGFVDKPSFSLDSCFSYIYGVDVYAQFGVDKKAMQKSFLTTKRRDGSSADLSEEQYLYASADVFYYPKLWEFLSQFKNKSHYLVDKQFIHNSLRWQRFGLPINEEIRQNLFDKVERDLEEVTQQLPGGLNVNSFVQVRSFLKTSSSTKEDLMRLEVEGLKEAGLVLKKRGLLKMKNFLERYNHERIRGFIAPTAISGRARCDGGDIEGTDNILQIPRKLKEVFGYPSEDPRFLVYCDYSQLELRTACCNTGERKIEKVFREGRDLHTHTASLMFDNLSYEEAGKDKEKRHAAKMCNFALLYCGSAASLKGAFLTNGGVDLPLEKAEEYRRAWLKAYPAFYSWHEQAREQYLKGDMLRTTPTGRSYTAKLFTDICGIENQSLGADAAKLGLNRFLELEPEARVLAFIHDAIIVEASNEEEARHYSKKLGLCMLSSWFDTISTLEIKDLPMPLDVNYGKNLKTIEEDNLGWSTPGLLEDAEEYKKLLLENKPSEERRVEEPLFKEKKLEAPEWKPPEECLHRDILFDADTAIFIAALENEDKEFEDALTAVKEYFSFTRDIFQAKSLTLYITVGKNFRYDLYKDYKANRNRDREPKYLKALRHYCAEHFKNIAFHAGFEADDLIVEDKKNNPEALLMAVDKDVLNAVPGRHFNYKRREIVEVSKKQALVWPYFQAIVGDSSDNIKGIPKVGPVGASKVVNENMTEPELWNALVQAYLSAGLTEEEALLNMRLVNMHQYKNRKLCLWRPENI